MFRKTLLLLVVLVPLLFLATSTKASAIDCSPIDGDMIWGNQDGNWVYLGSISNQFNSDSIANDFGKGSEFDANSIFDKFGDFGSEFSNDSAFDSFATNPPLIVNSDWQGVAYLTTNQSNQYQVNPYIALECAKESLASGYNY